MKPLTTRVTAKLAKAHIEEHVAYLTDAGGAVPLGQGKEWLKQFPKNLESTVSLRVRNSYIR